MSFAPLEFNREIKMSAPEVYQLRINANGVSDLKCYSDSIFSVIAPARSNTSSRAPEAYWTITRLPKTDLDIPLDKPTILTNAVVTALLIRADGRSDRPELSLFKFTTSSLPGNMWSVEKSGL